MFSKTAKNRTWIIRTKAPFLGALLSLVLAVSLFVGCKDDNPNTEPKSEPVLCTVGDDSPCELWQRCVATEGGQAHCEGERQCETKDNCPEGKICKGGVCVPIVVCEVGCLPESVCILPSVGCQPGCFEDRDCSGSRVCGGRDATTGLGACRNSTSTPEPVLVLCTVGDDSPCELWQRCVDQGNNQGHCVGERLCETNNECSDMKTCKGGICAPFSECKALCPWDEYVCSSTGGCQPGCFEDKDCSGSRICGGRDTTTGLGTCRNPK